jgi:hypothetical protein
VQRQAQSPGHPMWARNRNQNRRKGSPSTQRLLRSVADDPYGRSLLTKRRSSSWDRCFATGALPFPIAFASSPTPFSPIASCSMGEKCTAGSLSS